VNPVVLITDFGLADGYVGVLHAVLVASAPGVERIDLTHGVPPGDVWTGSFYLRCAGPHLPATAVVLAIVDPGVGTGRRAVAARIGDRWLVAPDNGLATALGTPASAVELDPTAMGLADLSATFHGRDLFAPAAARLARSEPPEVLGNPVAPADLHPCPLPEPVVQAATISGVILHVDGFGNLVTNIPAERVAAGAELRAGWRRIAERVSTYGNAPAGEPVLLEGSSGLLEIAIAGGSAAKLLELERGDPVELRGRGSEEVRR